MFTLTTYNFNNENSLFPAIKNTRFKKSYFLKTGLMYSIFIKFAYCTGSKPGGLKKGTFWDYWEIVDFFGIKKPKTLDFTRVFEERF